MNNSTAHKTLFIIGNGFDLDLNLKTSYHDFLDSSYFKSHVTIDFTKYDLERFNSDINIFNYLKYREKINGWIDVETELAKLASRKIQDNLKPEKVFIPVSKREKQTFQQLRIALCDYLKNISYYYWCDKIALVLNIIK